MIPRFGDDLTFKSPPHCGFIEGLAFGAVGAAVAAITFIAPWEIALQFGLLPTDVDTLGEPLRTVYEAGLGFWLSWSVAAAWTVASDFELWLARRGGLFP